MVIKLEAVGKEYVIQVKTQTGTVALSNALVELN
jgi:hypothetical protein